MISRLGRVLEALLGQSLAGASTTLSRAAVIALAAVVGIALVRAALALAARRFGWERSWIVRCPNCGRLAADPEEPSCPAGHRVRFPPGAARQLAGQGRRARAAALYAVLLSVAVAAAAFGAYSWLHIGDLSSPLSGLCAAAAFFFFLAALYAADFALSARRRGVGARLLHTGVALACLTPCLVLAFFSRGFEPQRLRVDGALWSTPAGIYVSDGKPRRLFPPAPLIEARLVEARFVPFDWQWRGLARFRLGSSEQPWRGRGGRCARWLEGRAEALGRHGVAVRRFSEEVPLPVNVKVLIIRRQDSLTFEAEPPR